MTVDERLYVHDDLVAHIEAPLNGGRTHMRQQDCPLQGQQIRVDFGLLLKDIKANARDRLSFSAATNAFSSMTSPRC